MKPETIFRCLTVLLVALQIALAGLVYYLVSHVPQTAEAAAESGDSSAAAGRSPQALYEDALHLYERGSFQEAAALVAGNETTLIALNDGCDLVISIYGEQADFERLERVAELCLANGHLQDPDLSYEGLAFSLGGQGRIVEAISRLKGERQHFTSPRFEAALARLHLMLGWDARAGDHMLKAVALADVSAPWIIYALKLKPLASDQEFIGKLLDVVGRKPKVNNVAAALLLKQAKVLGLDEQAFALRERLQADHALAGEHSESVLQGLPASMP